MSPGNSTALQVSIFERLTDERPSVTKESEYQRMAGIAEFTDSVRANLESLLNTRRSEDETESPYEEVNNSMLNFGILDFTSTNSADPGERERIRRSVEKAIRLFEPRLARIEVRISEWNNLNSAVKLEVEGLLKIGPEPMPIVFEATLGKDSRRFDVGEGF